MQIYRVKLFILFMILGYWGTSQQVPIQNYSTNNYGQVELEIEAQEEFYYILTTLHSPNLSYESNTSMTLGVNGTLIISEPLEAFPLQNYTITAYSKESPADIDGDGIDDMTEYLDRPSKSPLNFANEVPFRDGTTSITSQEIYDDLAVVKNDIPWAPFLNNQAFAKFAIVNQDTEEPEVYFINSKTHEIHADFLFTIGIDQINDDVVTGEIVYNPNQISPNGVIGNFSFNYSFGDSFRFEHTRRTFELLAANMPFLQNNMNHFIGDVGEDAYLDFYKNQYEGSRLKVVLESEFFADVDYLPFNQTEGYGFFRQVQLDENPGSRDIVLYDALPNSLPRVGGIITSVVQTPLSHVNLRAIQDNVPNAFIRDPLMIDSIANLLGKYIYYKVDQDNYEIKEASLEEVNEWFDNIRPTEDQIPERDLSQTKILPLDEIEFPMSTSFGAKCSNVATMRTFGFVEGTIPNGFGVPFYFYDEFMKYNGFYEDVEKMISDPDFLSDLETRIERLKDFRKVIKDADMPQWMLDELQAMHDSFPNGTSVRCRSSTNNEDLPGFSGAGLYTSKTQHPDEGHISKSIKQVYASMWNFRAYDERAFYRVDHLKAAMGVLCHPNYEDEKSNGVGVSLDPIYQTTGNFYLNTQVGESLVTNPDPNAVPEEILLSEDTSEGYFVLRNSSLVPSGSLVMNEDYLNQLRTYLRVIHDEFEVLYNVVDAEGFGMDIEYKVTREDQLIIKQARPWVSFWADIKSSFDLAAVEITNPFNSASLTDKEYISTSVENRGLVEMKDFTLFLSIQDSIVDSLLVTEHLKPQSSKEFEFTAPQDFSNIGDYNISVVVSHPQDGYNLNDTLSTVISKLHLLEAELTSVTANAICGEEIEVTAYVLNRGEQTFNTTEIEVISNGVIVDTFTYGLSIPYLAEVPITFGIEQNIITQDNEITLKILRVNGTEDKIDSNNSGSTTVNTNSLFQKITFDVKIDEYPQENSWELFDITNNEIVAFGNFEFVDFQREFCLNYKSCYELLVTDSAGDGICCDFGRGEFSILDYEGNTLIFNDGRFNISTTEKFCPSSEVCQLTAEVITADASDENSADGSITINPSMGIEPFQYSIDGGENYVSYNVFDDLMPGNYSIQIIDASEFCVYEEVVTINFNDINGVLDLGLNQITVYPNPTKGEINIAFGEPSEATQDIYVSVLNNLGKLVFMPRKVNSASMSEFTISLVNEPAGFYLIKCYNESAEKYFKVIKN